MFKTAESSYRHILFKFFFIYRWVMLFFALFMILNRSYPKVNLYIAFAGWIIAFAYTSLTHYFRKQIINLLEACPRLVIIDSIFGAVLLVIGGGWQNVFFAYAMAPIFVGVIFYGLTGGLITALVTNMGMFGSMWLAQDTITDIIKNHSLNPFIATIATFYLVGYFSSLPAKLIEHIAGEQNRNKVFLDQLTERKREIALLVAQGLSNEEIAAKLFVSKDTVKKHIREICNQFNLKNRTQIAVLISQNSDQLNSLSLEEREE